MDIEVFKKYVNFNRELDLFDLTKKTFIKPGYIELLSYEVDRSEEGRIDTIFKNMYNIDETASLENYKNIDIILWINGIDNPINIPRGTILKYPKSEEDFDLYRYDNTNNIDEIKELEKIIMPNKSTRKDKSREKWKENNFSVPPTVNKTPKKPVEINSNNEFEIGGLS